MKRSTRDTKERFLWWSDWGILLAVLALISAWDLILTFTLDTGPMARWSLIATAIAMLVLISLIARSRNQTRLMRERARDFFEVAADVFWETDARHRYTYLSQGNARILGHRSAAMIGANRVEMVEALLPEDRLKEHREALAIHAPFELDWYYEDDNGQRFEIQSSGSPCFDRKGRFVGYRGIARDVTDERQAARKQEQAAVAFDHATEAMLVIDGDNRIEHANPAADRLFGYPAGHLIGQDAGILALQADQAARSETAGEWSGDATVRDAQAQQIVVWACRSPIRGTNSPTVMSCCCWI